VDEKYCLGTRNGEVASFCKERKDNKFDINNGLLLANQTTGAITLTPNITLEDMDFLVSMPTSSKMLSSSLIGLGRMRDRKYRNSILEELKR